MKNLFEELRQLSEKKENVTITIKCNKSAADAILPLIEEMKKMCGQGSSRSIKIKDWEGNSNFGIDGDGPDHIESISIDESINEFVDVVDPLEVEMAARFLLGFTARRLNGPLSQDWRSYIAQAKELISKLKI